MDIIRNARHDYGVRPNLTDYQNARARFRWSDMPALCEGMGPSRCNIADAALTGTRRAQPRDAQHFGSSATRGWDGAITTRDLSYVELGRPNAPRRDGPTATLADLHGALAS